MNFAVCVLKLMITWLGLTTLQKTEKYLFDAWLTRYFIQSNIKHLVYEKIFMWKYTHNFRILFENFRMSNADDKECQVPLTEQCKFTESTSKSAIIVSLIVSD